MPRFERAATERQTPRPRAESPKQRKQRPRKQGSEWTSSEATFDGSVAIRISAFAGTLLIANLQGRDATGSGQSLLVFLIATEPSRSNSRSLAVAPIQARRANLRASMRALRPLRIIAIRGCATCVLESFKFTHETNHRRVGLARSDGLRTGLDRPGAARPPRGPVAASG